MTLLKDRTLKKTRTLLFPDCSKIAKQATDSNLVSLPHSNACPNFLTVFIVHKFKALELVDPIIADPTVQDSEKTGKRQANLGAL